MAKKSVSTAPPTAAGATNSVATVGKIFRLTADLGRTLRNNGPVALLSNIHYLVLVGLHRVFDRRAVTPEPASVSQVRLLDGLTIESEHRAEANYYEPTPRLVIGWILNLVQGDLANWSFLDVGAGRGRVVAMAASYPYRQVLGIEFAAELQNDARRHIASIKAGGRIACEVDVINADAVTFEIPAGPCFFYMFNTFRPLVLRKFLANVIASHQNQPRQMRIAYYNPLHSDVMTEFPQISECWLPLKIRIKFATLSPYGFRLYKIGEA